MNSIPQDTVHLLNQFREAARRTSASEPEEANKWMDEEQRIYKLLVSQEDGKKAIESLLADSDPHVRLGAASRVLLWNPALARPCLEDLRDSKSKDWRISLDAEMVLREFDKGTLSFDW